MKVWFDGFIFQHSPNGGIARYITNLVNHFSNQVEPHLLVLKDGFEGDMSIAHEKLSWHILPRFGFRPGRVSYAIEPMRARLMRWHSEADVFHPSYYMTLERRPPKGTPLVITCHDMTHERYPDELDINGFWRSLKKQCFDKSDAIVCVSEKTRHDLIEFYPHLAGRTVVIPLGADSLNPPHLAPSREHDDLLFVGGRTGYKQFFFAMKVVAELKRLGHTSIRLNVAGSPLNDIEKAEVERLQIADNVIACPHPSDEDLIRLYLKSTLLLYPSLWEGFGLPPLEAAKFGCLTVARSGTTVQDHLEDGALYGSGDVAAEWADLIDATLHSSQSLAALRSKAQERANAFTWNRTAEMTETLYRNLVP